MSLLNKNRIEIVVVVVLVAFWLFGARELFRDEVRGLASIPKLAAMTEDELAIRVGGPAFVLSKAVDSVIPQNRPSAPGRGDLYFFGPRQGSAVEYMYPKLKYYLYPSLIHMLSAEESTVAAVFSPGDHLIFFMPLSKVASRTEWRLMQELELELLYSNIDSYGRAAIYRVARGADRVDG